MIRIDVVHNIMSLNLIFIYNIFIITFDNAKSLKRLSQTICGRVTKNTHDHTVLVKRKKSSGNLRDNFGEPKQLQD